MGKGLLPKWKVPGVDICGSRDDHYIIRSDLGYYMKVKDLHTGANLTIHRLHPTCQGGEHYLAGDGFFIIIKETSFHQVSCLSTGINLKSVPLPIENQGGNHYLFLGGLYHIVNQSRRSVDVLLSLSSNLRAMMNVDLCFPQGLYYWSLHDRLYFLTFNDLWGLHFNYSKAQNFNTIDKTFTVHPAVIDFLPGGLSITHGPAYGIWENIATISGAAETSGNISKIITKKIGFEIQSMFPLFQEWTGPGISISELKALAIASVHYQYSLSPEYGGTGLNTDQEPWSEVIETEDIVSAQLEEIQSLYVWQYKLKLSKDYILHCTHTKLGHVTTPPTCIPLPVTNQKH